MRASSSSDEMASARISCSVRSANAFTASPSCRPAHLPLRSRRAGGGAGQAGRSGGTEADSPASAREPLVSDGPRLSDVGVLQAGQRLTKLGGLLDGGTEGDAEPIRRRQAENHRSRLIAPVQLPVAQW